MGLSIPTAIVTLGHGTNAVICAALMLLVLWQAPRQRGNQLFALMMLCLSAYSVLNVVGRFSLVLEIDATSLYLATNVLYLAFVTFLLFFAADFANLHGRLAVATQVLGVVANTLSVFALLSHEVLTNVYPLADGSGGFSFVPGLLFAPVVGAHLALLVMILIVLYRAKERHGRMLWPSAALILGGSIALGLRPILPLPLNSLFMLAFALWTGYVVLNHQLFNPIADLNRELAAANTRLAHAILDLEEVNRIKNQFLANMSHELRTPLNSVIGYTDLVLNELYGPLTDQQRDRLERVTRNGRHLLGLINDILDLSKIEAGRMDLSLGRVPTVDLIENVLVTIEPQAAEKSLTLIREYRGAPAIWGDETRVRQVLVNLLSNAVKFTEAGAITVHANGQQDDGTVLISVRDTGIGIPPDKQALVFEEFRQVDESTTRRYQGTGLGMAITRRLVEMHGGRIWLESTPGEGTTFYATLPAADAPHPHAPGPALTPRQLEPVPPVFLAEAVRRMVLDPASAPVLVVDSDDAGRALMLHTLARADYPAEAANSGLQAQTWLAAHTASLIVFSPLLPAEQGFDVLTFIRDNQRSGATPLLAACLACIQAEDTHLLQERAAALSTETLGVPLLVLKDQGAKHA
jgi:signal transduction histidine kinase/CheY-like chemotaxis protein